MDTGITLTNKDLSCWVYIESVLFFQLKPTVIDHRKPSYHY